MRMKIFSFSLMSICAMSADRIIANGRNGMAPKISVKRIRNISTLPPK